MKVFCWNVNSIKARLQIVIKFLQDEAPDVVFLQETKCIDLNFPQELLFDMGYNCYFHGQKSYNGVAILSKLPVEDVTTEIMPGDTQARYIEGRICAGNEMYTIASIYVPNGSDPKSEKFEYKMQYFTAISKRLQAALASDEKFILGGDFNVAPEAIDVYDAKHLAGKIGFHPAERGHFRKFINQGFVDTYRMQNGCAQEFSWWDYRTKGFDTGKGMRIDHILVSPNLVNQIKEAGIKPVYRGMERPSDHTPIFIALHAITASPFC